MARLANLGRASPDGDAATRGLYQVQCLQIDPSANDFQLMMQQSNASSESRGQIRNEQRRLSDHEPSLVLAVAATVIRRRRHTPHRLLQSAAAGLTCSSETDRRPAASGGGVATAHGPTGQLLYVLRRRRRLPPTHEYTTNGETRRHLIRYERVDRWHARRTKWEGKKNTCGDVHGRSGWLADAVAVTDYC